MTLQKSASIALATLVTVLVVSTDSYAAVGRVVSGVSGSQVNGWYSTLPTIRVDSQPACPSGSSGDVNLVLRSGEEGVHRITIRSHLNGYPRLYRDDQINGTETSGEIFSCSALSEPYTDVDPEVIWQEIIKIDLSPPKVSISSPSNNSNTNSALIDVAGSASDAVSGLQSVTINGVTATINGNSFSASVPVTTGLNTLTAVAKDVAGNTATSTDVVVSRNSSDKSTSNMDNQSNGGAPSNAITGSDAKGATDQELSDQKSKNVVSTPVKVAVGAGAAAGVAGIGAASYFGLIPYRKLGELIARALGK